MSSEQKFNLDDLQRADADHHLHPFTDTKSINSQGTRVIVKADGVYIWDAQGNKLLDGMAGRQARLKALRGGGAISD